jgi:ATP-dependent DNA helicase RecG
VGEWRGLQIANPEFELLGQGTQPRLPAEARITPVYPLTAGLSQRILRRLVGAALAEIPDDTVDPIPPAIRERFDLMPRVDAWHSLHFPATLEEAEDATRRLAFEELLLLQLLLGRLRASRARRTRRPLFDPDSQVAERILASLPFRLTAGQEEALGEILHDLSGTTPAARLLQGDVGCGKTVVAAIACASVAAAGSQACFLAPTEVLAIQHGETLGRLLEPAGIAPLQLLGRTPAAERREVLTALADGSAGVIVGTHALLEPDVRFRDLGLVVVDEQHRFGVYQRLALREKGTDPHTLVMSATPIPRTLSLTLYGDLEVTTIRGIPPGRTPILTRLVPRDHWDRLLVFVAERLRKGDQAFFVYPLVEESDRLELRDATRMRQEIAAHPAFRELRVGLLHGRVDPNEREATLTGLRDGSIQAVVATTVIEVGIDLPRATVMVVEHPERFGLAQLHQLRGRIGRAPGRTPYCFLMEPEGDQPIADRIRILTRESDGFRIAEEDLRLRGAGELVGARQTGLPRMRIADLIRDASLIPPSRECADTILEADPGLTDPLHRLLWREVAGAYPDGSRIFGTG